MQTSEKFHSQHNDTLESIEKQNTYNDIKTPEHNFDSDAVAERSQRELIEELLGNKVFAGDLYKSVSAINQKLLVILDKGAEQTLTKPSDMEVRRLMIEKI